MVSGMMISCKLQYLCHPFIIFDLWTLEFYLLAMSWVSHIWGKFLPFDLERLLGRRAERGGRCLLCACIACISTSDKKEIGESWKGRACGFQLEKQASLSHLFFDILIWWGWLDVFWNALCLNFCFSMLAVLACFEYSSMY